MTRPASSVSAWNLVNNKMRLLPSGEKEGVEDLKERNGVKMNKEIIDVTTKKLRVSAKNRSCITLIRFNLFIYWFSVLFCCWVYELLDLFIIEPFQLDTVNSLIFPFYNLFNIDIAVTVCSIEFS